MNNSIPAATRRSPVQAVSNRDYRGHELPSLFGPEIAFFGELEHAVKWLARYGGVVQSWDEPSGRYRTVQSVEAK